METSILNALVGASSAKNKPAFKMLVADTPEDIDQWPCPNKVFTGQCKGCDWCKTHGGTIK